MSIHSKRSVLYSSLLIAQLLITACTSNDDQPVTMDNSDSLDCLANAVALPDEHSDTEMGSAHIASPTGQPVLSLDATVDIGLALSITAHPGARVNMLGNALGDINGDGCDDVSISISYQPDKANAEIDYKDDDLVPVVFGSNASLAGSVDLSQRADVPGLLLRVPVPPLQDGDYRYVHSAVGVGDINGDGTDDMLVWGLFKKNAWVIYGSNNLPDSLVVNSLREDQGFEIVLPSRLLLGGRPAGDINNDGFQDLMFMSIVDAHNPISSDDRVSVVFGSASPPTRIDADMLDGINGVQLSNPTIDGDDLTANIGRAVSVGDINGDTIDDLAISAPGKGFYSSESGNGYLYLIYGKQAGFPANIDLASLPSGMGRVLVQSEGAPTISGSLSGDNLDGDNLADLLVGTKASTTAPDAVNYLIRGSTDVDDANLGTMPTSKLATISGFTATDDMDLELIGDINGDSISDMFLRYQTRRRDLETHFYYASAIVLSPSTGISSTLDIDELADNGHVFWLESSVANAPTVNELSIRPAGDIDGDGRQDLLVSRWQSDEGRAYLISGKAFDLND